MVSNGASGFSQRFIDGLKGLGHDPDIVALEWYICGSDHAESTKALYRKHYPVSIAGDSFPAWHGDCICGEPIKGAQCWITDGSGETMTVGPSCCLKAFLDYKGKTCSQCHAPHRRKSSNRCVACAVVCRGCPQEIDLKYSPVGVCAQCLRLGKRPCAICGSLYNKPKPKFAGADEGQPDICEECLKRHCADCGKVKPAPAYRICLPCKKARDDVGNECEECGKRCGGYSRCYDCKDKQRVIEPEALPEAFYKRHRGWFPNGVRE